MNMLRKFRILIFCLLLHQIVFGQSKTEYSFRDSTKSTININKVDTGQYEGQYKYSIYNTDYSIEYLYKNKQLTFYIVKKETHTVSYSNTEYINSEISIDLVPLDDKNVKSFKIFGKYDAINLRTEYYEAINYGCCGGENDFTYFSYDTGKILAKGKNKIVSYEIPNARINCYLGFETNESNDSTLAGVLSIGYNNGEKYMIKVKEKKPNQYHSSPEIKIKTGNSRDQIFDDSDTPSRLWSLDSIKGIEQINNLKILLLFDTYARPDIIEIPIINGKPFGKSANEQTIKRN